MKISFLGDSITYGYDLENKDERFATLICKKMGAEEANFGITGTLMARAGMNRNDGKSFLDRVHLVLDGDIIVIFGGTNDYFWGDTPIGDKMTGDAGFYCAVDKICKRISDSGCAHKTLIVTPYPHNGVGNFYGGNDYEHSSRHDTDVLNYNGHKLVDYVNVLEKIATEYNISVLNLHKVSGFDWKAHTTDGCHPNTCGHKWLAEKICDDINKLFIKNIKNLKGKP